MMTVDRPDSFKKFAKSCKDFLEENPLLYYFLDKTISDVLLGKIKFYFAFTITKGGVGRIVTLVAGDICLIYENGFDHEMFDEFCKQIEFHKFNRFNFAGSKKLIDTLFAKYGATFDSTKHRIIYNCNQVSQRCSYSPGSFRMANFADAEKMIDMSIAFSEAYDGTTVPRHEAMMIIMSGIQKNNLYKWEDKGEICAIAQAMHEEYDFPVIGHFYTDPTKRNQGYGTSIVHRLTKGLLDVGNPFCMLVADATNPASNKAFLKAGYLATGEYVRGYKPL